MRRFRLAMLVAVLSLALFPHAQSTASATSHASGRIVAREVTLTDPTRSAGVLSTPVFASIAGDTGSTGPATLLYTSPSVAAGQLFDRVGLHWVAKSGTEDSLAVELRTSADGSDWNEWAALIDHDDIADPMTNTRYAEPHVTVDGARYAQYRVWLTGGDAGALVQVGLTFIDVSDLNAGPLARLANDVATALGAIGDSYAQGAAGAPKILTRQDWGADESLMTWTPQYQHVQKAIIHHTVTDDGGTNVASTIRAIYYYHAVTRGWGDIGYNYLVDKFGNIWTGRAGGDHVIGGHAYGWNNGSIGIASIGTYATNPPTSALQGAIANIIAVKFSQFDLQPYGADTFVHQEQRSDGSWANVPSNPPNIQGHRDANYIVGTSGGQTECPGNGIYGMLDGLRSLAQTAVQGGYTNLARIEPNLAKAGLAGAVVPVTVTVFNVGRSTIPAGTAVSYQVLRGGSVVTQGPVAPLAVAIAPGGSANVSIGFSVPPIGSYTVRWDLQSGNATWNALYNAPVRDTWFRSADWSADWISDTVPKTWFAGQTTTVSVTVTNDGGRVWNAQGIDPVQLGYRWIDDASGQVTAGSTFVSLQSDVQAGQTVTLAIPVTAPVTSSNYVMELDLRKQNQFWFKDKGIPADPTPIGVGLDFKASYAIGAMPAVNLAQTATVPVTITNLGQGAFPILTATPVDLGYHWYDAAGKLVVWDGPRTKLPADLLPGRSVPLLVPVQAPPVTNGGPYQLRFDLVQEGVSWFSGKGLATGNVNVTVCCVKTFGATYQPQVATLAVSGQLSTVPIAVTNTGNFVWNAAGPTPVDLGYHWYDSAGKAVVWDGLRTKLPSDVAPGATQTLQAQLQFPTAPGAYTLKWDLVQEGVAWFSSQNVAPFPQGVTVNPAVVQSYAAAIDASGIPTALATRMITTVAINVGNPSSAAWGSNINLSYHWYDANGAVVVWDGLRTSLNGIQPGQTVAVYPRIAGPVTAGGYTLRFDLVQEGVAWFSSKGTTFDAIPESIVQPTFGAVYTVPAAATGAPGATITLPVRLTNAGSLSWDPAKAFDLAYHLFTPSGAVVVWDGARTALPGPVGPGQSVTVNATVVVPPAGSYALKFDLVQEGVSWFSGQGVPAESISLTAQ
ncbi:MAG TPA: N-acetylmuramoyl-L-alanine amidase [Candidatus Limnocylindria bacterium]|nr:N-acetylmuramoyl-L-alanine amidase [Candidatus Limnocylindria bacterium]